MESQNWQFEILGQFPVLLEGPAWDGSGVLFTEIAKNRIHRFDPETGDCTVWREETGGANGLMFDAQGVLYACEGHGRRIVRIDNDGVHAVADRFEGHRFNSPNDLAIDGLGRIWFSDPRYTDDRHTMELEHESVFRLDPQPEESWTVRRMTFDTTRPNGLLIAPDQKTLYVAQSEYGENKLRELRAYPINDDDSLGPYRVMHNFYPHRGIDGMCLDIEGNIIATVGWNESGPGPMIYVFSPSGRVLQTHPVPVDRPTNCTFGDSNLRTLYVTTASGYLLRARTPMQGYVLYPSLNAN
jgi:gluconolactonase